MSAPTASRNDAKSAVSVYENMNFQQICVEDELSKALTKLSVEDSGPKSTERAKNVPFIKERKQTEKVSKDAHNYVNVDMKPRAPIGSEVPPWKTQPVNPSQWTQQQAALHTGQKRNGSEQVYHNLTVGDGKMWKPQPLQDHNLTVGDGKMWKPQPLQDHNLTGGDGKMWKPQPLQDHNLTGGDGKLWKPQPLQDLFEQKRFEIARRQGLSSNYPSVRKQSPVESIDPSCYSNGSLFIQKHADSNNYDNISCAPSIGSTVPHSKDPVASPRPGPMGVSCLDVNLPELVVREEDFGPSNYANVLYQNSPGTAGVYSHVIESTHGKHSSYSVQQGTTIGFQRAGNGNYRAPQISQHYPESLSPASQYSSSQSNSPLGPQGYHSPQQGYHSPRTLGYTTSQPMISPSHQSAYSPSASNHSYQVAPSPDDGYTYTSSPSSSQHVPSPYSHNAGANSPDEPTLYPTDPAKLPGVDSCPQEHMPSLCLSDLDLFQALPINGDGYSANTVNQGVGYAVSPKESPYELFAPNTLDDPQGEHAKRPTSNIPHQEPLLPHGRVAVGPLSELYPGPTGAPYGMHGGHLAFTGIQHVDALNRPIDIRLQGQIPQSYPVSQADVKPPAAAPNGKMLLPAKPKPHKPVVQPVPATVLVLIPQQQQQRRYQTLAPKPTEGEAPKETKAKTKKAPKSKSDKNSGAARGSRSPPNGNVKADLIAAKARIAMDSDEHLLSKQNGETVLHKAIMLRKQEVVLAILGAMKTRPLLQSLLETTNSKQQTPLFLSLITGQTWLTETLIKMGADCNTQCQYEACEGELENLSPLHYASKHGDRCLKELQAILASPKTDLNEPDRSGMPPLHMALWYHGEKDTKTKKTIDSGAVVKALLAAGAQAHTTHNNSGKTALHCAVDKGSLELTRLLLESNCQLDTLINMTNYEQRTALHLAVSLLTISEENQIDLVQYLIRKGANKNCKDNDRKIPKELISPTRSRLLAVFDEPTTPPSTYSDDDSYIPNIHSP